MRSTSSVRAPLSFAAPTKHLRNREKAERVGEFAAGLGWRRSLSVAHHRTPPRPCAALCSTASGLCALLLCSAPYSLSQRFIADLRHIVS
jgi:hypothetical protein